MSDQGNYFYEHEDGSVIKKPKMVVDMAGGPWVYFNSPFVKKWWFEETSNDTSTP